MLASYNQRIHPSLIDIQYHNNNDPQRMVQRAPDAPDPPPIPPDAPPIQPISGRNRGQLSRQQLGSSRSGSVKRLGGNIKRVVQALEVENATYTAVGRHEANLHAKSPSYIDIAEGFAGKALITTRASAFGLRAAQPAEINDGWDLSTREGARRWEYMIVMLKPLVVLIGWSCTLWCQFNRHINYKDFPELLDRLQDETKPMLRLMMWTIKMQDDNVMCYLFENPPTSAV